MPSKKIEALIQKYETSKLKEYIEVDGNFTICELKLGKVRAFGVSKCNCTSDNYNADRGTEIAFFRALKKLDKALGTTQKAKKGTKARSK